MLTAEVSDGTESNKNIHFSLLPSDQKSLGINPANGEIYIQNPLDFETEPYITVNIVAAGTYDSGKNTSRLLRINVENVDDNVPQFFYHPEENGTMTLVVDDTIEDSGEKKIGKLQAVDLDSPPFNDVYYYLFPCSENPLLYRVDRSSGELFQLRTTGHTSDRSDFICGLARSGFQLL